ncbi:MAG: fructose-bisphosphatase class II family protein [Hyphomicrobiales bacterium]|nr:fructose-bisphosphatase class II family protein [Hyphomicrobiales bacterium]
MLARIDNPCRGPIFVYALRALTESAARAAAAWIGRGDRGRSGDAATRAMIDELSRLPIRGRVVVGEGLMGGDPAAATGGMGTGLGTGLGTGTSYGDASAPLCYDLAVDPVEGTSYLARGMTNAMAVIALTTEGAMFDPGPAFYMEKFVAPPVARGRIDPQAPVETKLKTLAHLLDKAVADLTVFVLEKPRHRELVERIHAAGARVALYPAGDVAGALMAALPDPSIDALMGTGGTREGLISACAVKALGGEFLARIDPQLATEKAAVQAAGIDVRDWHGIDDLVRGDEIYFAATGITTGLLFEGVQRVGGEELTQSLLIAGPGRHRQLLTSYHAVATDA